MNLQLYMWETLTREVSRWVDKLFLENDCYGAGEMVLPLTVLTAFAEDLG